MGLFDPDSFMTAQQEGNLSTQRLVITPGVYPACIENVDIKSGEKDEREWAALDVTWQVEDEGVKAALKREVVKVHQQFFLDLTEGGDLDRAEGRNVDLGRLLKAVGLHGKNWSPADLTGRRALVHVKGIPIKDSPDGDVRSEVRGVAALV